MTTSAISHSPLKTPDWLALKIMPVQPAANALRSILFAYDSLEKQVFALRGMAALLIEERELFKEIYDPEVGEPYQSFDRFLKQEFPNSWSYIRDALRAVKELRQVPFEDLLQIKRCNLEQLKRVSSSVRILPEVVQAAKVLPEKKLVEKLNKEYSQHLEVRQPVVMAEASVSDKVDEAVEMAIALYGCKSRGEALECVASDFIDTHAVEYEHMAEAG
jgi:hypothetical protein